MHAEYLPWNYFYFLGKLLNSELMVFLFFNKKMMRERERENNKEVYQLDYNYFENLIKLMINCHLWEYH